MDVTSATMTVPWGQAQEAYHAYRRTIKDGKATKDDVAIYRAYHALMCGKKVIDVPLAISAAGLDAHGLPKLAVGRADWPFVHAWWSDARCFFTRGERPWGRRDRVMAHNLGVKFDERPSDWSVTGKAQVPTVPPQFRPKGALSGYRVLFEAVWQRRPPVDPLLLKHLEGPFYVVLAAWDLSPLEQAVLRAKL